MLYTHADTHRSHISNHSLFSPQSPLLKHDCSRLDRSEDHNESVIPGNIHAIEDDISMNSKFDDIKCIIPGNIDVMIFVETKLDDSFPTSQFIMDGFAKLF